MIPDGADAVLVHGKHEVVLTTRSGTVKGELRSQDQLLCWMAELGLTTVAIPKQDAFRNQEQVMRIIPEREDGSAAKLSLLNGR